jgi:hypothetical protein
MVRCWSPQGCQWSTKNWASWGRQSKQGKETGSVMVKRKNEMNTVRIYKICMPYYFTYPPGEVIIKVCFTKESAEKYIEDCQNAFIKQFLTIETEDYTYGETD